LPQAPQLPGSLSVLTHVPPQRVVLKGQQLPFVQVLMPPQKAPSALFTHPLPLAAHCWQLPPQASVQQTLRAPLETQDRPSRQSAAFTQASPGPLPWGAAHPPGVQRGVAPAQTSVPGWQVPSAVHWLVVRVVPAQLAAAPQGVPAGSRRHAPAPLQPLVQSPTPHSPPGSAPPTGTSAQVPCCPGSAQDLHSPLQASLQQKPCAQWPLSHEPSALQGPPLPRLPQEPPLQTMPSTHWALLPQLAAHALPLQPLNGAQLCISGAGQVPPVHFAAMTATLAAASQRGGLQTVSSS
jgi:hypothetical protein